MWMPRLLVSVGILSAFVCWGLVENKPIQSQDEENISVACSNTPVIPLVDTAVKAMLDVLRSSEWTAVHLFYDNTIDVGMQSYVMDELSARKTMATVNNVHTLQNMSVVLERLFDQPGHGDVNVLIIAQLDVTLQIFSASLEFGLKTHNMFLTTFKSEWLVLLRQENIGPFSARVSKRFENVAAVVFGMDGHLSLRTLQRSGDDVHFSLITKLPAARPLTRHQMLPNPAYRLGGRTLRVVTKEWEKFVIADTNAPNSYSGMCIDLLNELSRTLNFSYTLTGFTADWNSLVDQIKYKKQDLVATTVVMNSQRREFSDATTPVYYDDFSLIYKRPTDRHRGSTMFTHPFKTAVFVALGISFVGMLVLLLGFETVHTIRTTPVGRRRTTSGIGDERRRHTAERTLFLRVAGAVEVLVAGTLNRSFRHEFESRVTQMLVWVWSLFCVILASAYSSKLTSSLTVTDHSLPFTSVEELVKLDTYTWGILPNTAEETLVRTSKALAMRMFYQKMQTFAEDDPSVLDPSLATHHKKCEQGNYVYFGYRATYVRWKEHDCSLITTLERISPLSYAFLLQKGSPYTQLFSTEILYMFEAGLMTNWQRHWESSNSSHTCLPDDARRGRVITLSDVYTAFCGAGLGAGVAILTLGLEVCWNTVTDCWVYGTQRPFQ